MIYHPSIGIPPILEIGIPSIAGIDVGNGGRTILLAGSGEVGDIRGVFHSGLVGRLELERA